jgi:D-alanyl-D-alanine carboxypeptidase (penicillin-binding protein 5/6)
MTLIVALEQGNLEDIVTVSKNAAGLEGSTLWLEQGDKVPLRELLYGMMMASGNDATVAVAEHIAGSVPAFVRLMNEKAAAVGAKDTHFVNPNGLPDENHYTTAHDMALIASYGYSLPEFEKIVSTKEITFPWVKDDTHRLRNENQMLWLFEGGNGVKTGYTDAAGRCLVSGAREKGLQLVAVVLDSVYMWNDSIALLDYGFDNVEPEKIFRKGEIVGSVSVGLFQGELEVKAARDLSVGRLKDGPKVVYDKKLEVSEKLTAPIKEGEKVGRMVLLQDGKPVGAVDVLAAKSLTEEEHGFFYRLIAWFRSMWKGLF